MDTGTGIMVMTSQKLVNLFNQVRPNAVVPLPDFLKIGSSAEIREVGIEIIIQK